MTIDHKKQLELLIKLQAIDTKLHRLGTEQSEIPEQINIAKKELALANEKFASLKINFDSISNEYKKLEEEVSHWKHQVKKREAKLYTVNNNRDYQAITREVAEIKRSNREREEKMIVFMEQLEILEPDTKRAEDLVKEKELIYQKATEGTEIRLREIEAEIIEIAKDKPALTAELDKMLLRKYNFIKQRFPNALVQVKDNICGGCHTRIPYQMINKMLSFDAFVECPSCRRILFIEEKTEEGTLNKETQISNDGQ